MCNCASEVHAAASPGTTVKLATHQAAEACEEQNEMNTILILLLAYFCGAVPTGYWVVRAWKQVDLTKVGSGSTGTTNVLRTAGKAAAAFVFVVDVAKGY